MSLKRLQVLIHDKGPDVYDDVISTLSGDPRGGAQRLVKYCQSKLEDWRQERHRIERMFSYERQVWAMGYKLIAGIDEVGRGPLAGPVVAAAVILPAEVYFQGLDEAKRLSGRRRHDLFDQIKEIAVSVGIGLVHPDGIDEASVMMATYKAMIKAVSDLSILPDYLLIDALHLPNVNHPQALIVGGEGLSCSIAAASVVAKVTRDDYMIEMDKFYPQYGFANHKGYGTVEHREAIERYGLCPIHRKTFGAERGIIPLTPGSGLAEL